jgi:5-methylcytosine-specific restriction endonuclease McrA
VPFTIGKEGHDRLRRLQALLRREIPNGDPAAIVDRALILLLAQVEKAKLGAAAKPGPIRPWTDSRTRTPIIATRHIPRATKREVSKRDGGQCTHVAPDGRRCSERHFLEFHHIRPYAQGGEATVDNITLRCRRHNQYEADLIFGPRAGTALPRAIGHSPGGAHGPAVPTAPGTTRATPG